MTSSVAYHLTGILQAILFFLIIGSQATQWRKIRRRRREIARGALNEPATHLLSMGFIFGSFFAFYSYLLLATSIIPFSHYLFWTRLPACLMALALASEIAFDRAKILPWAAVLLGGGLILVALLAVIFLGNDLSILNQRLQWIVILGGGSVIVGQFHQFQLIRLHQRSGALSYEARFLNLCKDLGTLLFAICTGLSQAWSVALIATTNGLVTLLVLRELKKHEMAGSANLTLQPKDP